MSLVRATLLKHSFVHRGTYPMRFRVQIPYSLGSMARTQEIDIRVVTYKAAVHNQRDGPTIQFECYFGVFFAVVPR